MDTSTVREGDIIRCDVRGDKFYASVRSPVSYNPDLRKRVLTVTSLTGRPIPTRFITPRQVIGHWRQSRRNRTTPQEVT